MERHKAGFKGQSPADRLAPANGATRSIFAVEWFILDSRLHVMTEGSVRGAVETNIIVVVIVTWL